MPPHDPPSRRIINEEEPTNRDIYGAVDRMDKRLQRVEVMLNGSDSDYEGGLLAKVHTLTQAHESRKGWTVVAVGAAMSGVGAALWIVLKQAFKGEA